MSFCRFSTDDFQCDLYCYESNSGYETMVAGARFVFKEPLPEKVEWSQESSRAFFDRHEKVMRMTDEADSVPIGLPHDSGYFCDDTPEEWLETLLMLRETGYNFPDHVIEAAKEEIEAVKNNFTSAQD